MSRGLPEARLYSKADKLAWSANDILAHLRACADVWGRSIEAMIAQDFHDSLRAFTRQRMELVKTLKALKSADWSRGATFTATATGREQTILIYVRRIADHEHEHLEQLKALLQ